MPFLAVKYVGTGKRRQVCMPRLPKGALQGRAHSILGPLSLVHPE